MRRSERCWHGFDRAGGVDAGDVGEVVVGQGCAVYWVYRSVNSEGYA